MDLAERLVYLAIGGGIGFVLGYIVKSLRDAQTVLHDIKEELDEVEECVKQCQEKHDHVPKTTDRGEDGFMRRPLVADVAYLFSLGLVLYGLFLMGLQADKLEEQADKLEQNAHNDLVTRCESGVESRNAQRAIVDAVYGLATGAINRDKNAPPLTQEEIVRVNAYIDRANAFRKDLYGKIKPAEHCEPFVEDENVKPPTPPYPHFKVKD